MRNFLKTAAIGLCAVIVICGFLILLADDEPASESGAGNSDLSSGDAGGSNTGGSDPGADARVTAPLQGEDAHEGEMSAELVFGSGYEEIALHDTYDPDRQVVITRSARPVRPVRKQDVYGRVLSDDFYFYRNMLSKSERAIYDQIYANALEADPYFDVSGVQVPHGSLDRIVLAVRFDNPDLFWLLNQYHYTYDRNGNLSSVTLAFYDCVENLDEYKAAFYGHTDSVLEQVMYFADDIDKVKYIHDLLTYLNDYNWGPMNQSAYSAVCYRETVCAGYSMAFQYYMQRLGIPSAIVYGNTKEKHLWNIVYLDGDFYAVDITWDDPIGNPSNVYYYNYFNITDSDLSPTHSRQSLATQLPVARGTMFSYGNYYGSSPGSSFAGLDYGSPRSALPPVYPGAARHDTPEESLPEPSASDEESGGDTFDYDIAGEIEDDYDTYYEFYDWTDEEWELFWDELEEQLSEEELALIAQLTWEDFFAIMQEAEDAA